MALAEEIAFVRVLPESDLRVNLGEKDNHVVYYMDEQSASCVVLCNLTCYNRFCPMFLGETKVLRVLYFSHTQSNLK